MARFLNIENLKTSLASVTDLASDVGNSGPKIDYYDMDRLGQADGGGSNDAFDVLRVWIPAILLDLRDIEIIAKYWNPSPSKEEAEELGNLWTQALTKLVRAVKNTNEGALKTNEMRERLGPIVVSYWKRLRTQIDQCQPPFRNALPGGDLKNKNETLLRELYSAMDAGTSKAAVRVEDIFSKYPTNQYGDVISKYAEQAKAGIAWTGQA